MNEYPRYISALLHLSQIDSTLNAPEHASYDLVSITPVITVDSVRYLIVMVLRPLSYRDARGVLSPSDERSEASIDRVREPNP